ncbi:MAG TPA: hypothetical protein VG738_24025 [Chitinophagaceae bacterium]|nr:hypothetical protein [Chitinophagaceae bacterium]
MQPLNRLPFIFIFYTVDLHLKVFFLMKAGYIILLSLAFSACFGGRNNYPKAENAFDAGREFIDGCLKGEFSRASFYMVNDSENNKDLQQIKTTYNGRTQEQKQLYYQASIIVNEDATISDTVHIINYMNSYDKIARKVKVVLRNNTWQVDFKYTFNGNL